MATKVITMGKVGMTPAGRWNANTVYDKLDGVLYNGDYWQSKARIIDSDVNRGHVPQEGSIWWERMTDASGAVANTEEATNRANAATAAANTATANANRAAENADAKAELANTAASQTQTLKGQILAWFGSDDTTGIRGNWKTWFDAAKENWSTWWQARKDEWKAWYTDGVVPNWNAWYSNTQTAWNNWFSDSLSTGVRKLWNDWWPSVQQSWQSWTDAEAARANAEVTRQSNESTRQSNETTRQENEQIRQSQESGRVSAENDRVVEFARLKSESETATALADDVGHHPAYIDASGWVYEYDSTAKQYNRTDKNVRGRNFTVDKVFKSVAEMSAYRGPLLEEGNFFVINTGSVEDEDTGKLYIVNSLLEPEFLFDMSGMRGFTGHTPQFTIGTVTTGNPDSPASVTITDNGTDPVTGDPKFLLNLTIPKGDTFRWSDLTAENIIELQRPATEAAERLDATRETVEANEAARVEAEIIRESNEDTRETNELERISNENDRVSAETTRQSAWTSWFGATAESAGGVRKIFTDWLAEKLSEWTTFKGVKDTDWDDYKDVKDADWIDYKEAKDADWNNYKTGKDTNWTSWLSDRLSAWTNWFGEESGTPTKGVRKTWGDWYDETTSAWTSWFSDTLATGIRKIWTEWFEVCQSTWDSLTTAITSATTRANTAAEHSENLNAHPAFIGDGTNGDLNFWYLWDYTNQMYVKGPYAKGDNLNYNDMTPEEQQALVDAIKADIMFASEETCEELLNELT